MPIRRERIDDPADVAVPERPAVSTDRASAASIDAGHWQRRLDTLARRHQVPGAALGIRRIGAGRPDEVAEAAYGVLNKATGVAATTDSVFQIGSITKVWTAALVMQLLDEDRLDLDTPVLDVLPDFRLADDGGDRFAVRRPPAQAWGPVAFYRPPSGEPYLYMGYRSTPKVA
jgi:CubicO group peptidase (beta-lactamase class C family)